MKASDPNTQHLPTKTDPPQTAQNASWDTHLMKVPSAREPNEQATTDQVRLAGHIVEILSGNDSSSAHARKVYRYRLVREEDGHVIFDQGNFKAKHVGRNMMKKAINAQYEVNRAHREAKENSSETDNTT